MSKQEKEDLGSLAGSSAGSEGTTPSEKRKSPVKTKTAELEKEVEELEEQDESDPLMSHRSRSPRSRAKSRSLSGGSSEAEPTDCQGRLRQFLEGRTFEYIMGVVILLNCASIVWQISEPQSNTPAEWLVINIFFLCIYVTEISLKIFAMGFMDYFHVGWHKFDVFVTCLAAIQVGAYYSVIDERLMSEYHKYVSGDMVQILRLFRLLRLARIFPELAILIQAFITSTKALAWIALMAIMWFYLCACAATVFIGRKEWLPTEVNPTEPDDIREVRERFGSIPLSMFALFEVMTLEGWCDYVRPLLENRPVIVFAFLIFIFVSAFFLLNLVTAVVVDRTLTAQKEAKQETAQDLMSIEKEHIDVLYEVLLQLNDGNDIIQRDHFMDCLRNPSVSSRLVAINWNRDFMISIFELIDHDNDAEASMMRMRKLWIACHEPLDTQNFVRFQINLAHRMEYSDKVAFTVLEAIEKISGKKMQYADEMRVKPSFLSSKSQQNFSQQD
jgi:voltage-gated sodium channel